MDFNIFFSEGTSPWAPLGVCLLYQYKQHPPFSKFLRPDHEPGAEAQSTALVDTTKCLRAD